MGLIDQKSLLRVNYLNIALLSLWIDNRSKNRIRKFWKSLDQSNKLVLHLLYWQLVELATFRAQINQVQVSYRTHRYQGVLIVDLTHATWSEFFLLLQVQMQMELSCFVNHYVLIRLWVLGAWDHVGVSAFHSLAEVLLHPIVARRAGCEISFWLSLACGVRHHSALSRVDEFARRRFIKAISSVFARSVELRISLRIVGAWLDDLS